jgi:peptidoglycan hydrolase-like amidase
MAKDGKNYEEILLNYYTGTTVRTDSSTPATVKYGGKNIPLVEYLCRTTEQEIGPSSPTEALKAQIVAVYTFAKWYDFDVEASRHAYDSTYNYVGTNLHKACLSVLGMENDSSKPTARYVDYNGSAAFTCYFDSCAGKTTAAASTWGGNYPYLCGGNPSPETVEIATAEFTVEEMKDLILAYNSDAVLKADPAQWLKIISHDEAYSSSVGYVEKMKIGDKEIRGNAFRGSVMDYKIRSHCFSMEYIPA